MSKFVKSKLNSKVLALPGYLMSLCVSKDIEVIDNNTFVLDNKGAILDYHISIGNYANFVKNM